MNSIISIEPLTKTAFEPFGDLIDTSGAPDKIINQGLCGRYHDRASLDFGSGRAGISLFEAKPRSLPYVLDMMERHPEGSQAFIPMSMVSFLVIVAGDENGRPARPHAFLTEPGQAVNLHKGTWHGVLTPLVAPGLFAVVDRIGEGLNLEEHSFNDPYSIEPTTNHTGT